ncbi:hypothetical protein OC834_006917 [Tilletia horrida]|nr:hypothetical protein OC834_006917 [Tilletia horrida]
MSQQPWTVTRPSAFSTPSTVDYDVTFDIDQQFDFYADAQGNVRLEQQPPPLDRQTTSISSPPRASEPPLPPNHQLIASRHVLGQSGLPDVYCDAETLARLTSSFAYTGNGGRRTYLQALRKEGHLFIKLGDGAASSSEEAQLLHWARRKLRGQSDDQPTDGEHYRLCFGRIGDLTLAVSGVIDFGGVSSRLHAVNSRRPPNTQELIAAKLLNVKKIVTLLQTRRDEYERTEHSVSHGLSVRNGGERARWAALRAFLTDALGNMTREGFYTITVDEARKIIKFEKTSNATSRQSFFTLHPSAKLLPSVSASSSTQQAGASRPPLPTQEQLWALEKGRQGQQMDASAQSRASSNSSNSLAAPFQQSDRQWLSSPEPQARAEVSDQKQETQKQPVVLEGSSGQEQTKRSHASSPLDMFQPLGTATLDETLASLYQVPATFADRLNAALQQSSSRSRTASSSYPTQNVSAERQQDHERERQDFMERCRRLPPPPIPGEEVRKIGQWISQKICAQQPLHFQLDEDMLLVATDKITGGILYAPDLHREKHACGWPLWLVILIHHLTPSLRKLILSAAAKGQSCLDSEDIINLSLGPMASTKGGGLYALSPARSSLYLGQTEAYEVRWATGYGRNAMPSTRMVAAAKLVDIRKWRGGPILLMNGEIRLARCFVETVLILCTNASTFPNLNTRFIDRVQSDEEVERAREKRKRARSDQQSGAWGSVQRRKLNQRDESANAESRKRSTGAGGSGKGAGDVASDMSAANTRADIIADTTGGEASTMTATSCSTTSTEGNNGKMGITGSSTESDDSTSSTADEPFASASAGSAGGSPNGADGGGNESKMGTSAMAGSADSTANPSDADRSTSAHVSPSSTGDADGGADGADSSMGNAEDAEGSMAASASAGSSSSATALPDKAGARQRIATNTFSAKDIPARRWTSEDVFNYYGGFTRSGKVAGCYRDRDVRHLVQLSAFYMQLWLVEQWQPADDWLVLVKDVHGAYAAAAKAAGVRVESSLAFGHAVQASFHEHGKQFCRDGGYEYRYRLQPREGPVTLEVHPRPPGSASCLQMRFLDITTTSPPS